MQLVIRLATISDIPDMYAITLRAHQYSYTNLIPLSRRQEFVRRYTASRQSMERYAARMTSRLTNPVWRVWIAELNGKVAGYTLAQHVRRLRIQKRGLFVDPDYYGQGIGTSLFEKSIEDTEKGCVVRLSVIENNERAKRLYKKHGFKRIASAPTTFFGAKLDVMEYIKE